MMEKILSIDNVRWNQKILFTKRAKEDIERLSRKEKEKVEKRIIELSRNPIMFPNVIKLKGEWEGFFKLKIYYLRRRKGETYRR